MKGKTRRGRQKKRWEDNIKEWTGMDLPAQRIVAKSSVVLQQPCKVMG